MAKRTEPTAQTEPTAESAEPVAGSLEPVADPHADVAQLSYEQARDELTVIVDRLESGQTTLEESVSLWQRGELLAAHCSYWLDRARDQVAAIEDE